MHAVNKDEFIFSIEDQRGLEEWLPTVAKHQNRPYKIVHFNWKPQPWNGKTVSGWNGQTERKYHLVS